MKIIVLDPNGHNVLELKFSLLDIDIPRGRHIIIRSIAFKHGFLTGTSIRKDAQGVGYIEIKMRPETSETKLSLLSKALVNELV